MRIWSVRSSPFDSFDDWEWRVDLFADNPPVFKKLIYEMRFDEVSAVYALFGQFYVGVRLQPGDLRSWFKGRLSSQHILMTSQEGLTQSVP